MVLLYDVMNNCSTTALAETIKNPALKILQTQMVPSFMFDT